MLSVVVPLGCERDAASLEAALASCGTAEVRVVAGADVPQAVVRSIRQRGIACGQSDAPRGMRLREGARATRGDVLVFLHADSVLPTGWGERLQQSVNVKRPWGAFRLAFDAPGLRLIALGANLRARLFGLPWGDQSQFVMRETYEAVGGHPPWPLLDDHELARRLGRIARPLLLTPAVRTSARRYRQRGALRCMTDNVRVLLHHAAGRDVNELARSYRR